MRNSMKILGRLISRKAVSLLVCCMVLSCLSTTALAVAPTDGAFGAGVGNFAGSTPGNTVVNILTPNAIMDWTTFNTVAGENLTFNQLGTDSAVLNRVGGPTTIFNGNLTAPGRVFIVNPSGIVFGPSAFLQASQLVASGNNITNVNFLTGLVTGQFAFVGGTGTVINAGTIEAQSVALIGQSIANLGIIRTPDPDGFIAMGAGQAVLLNQNNSNIFALVATPANVINNGGSLSAPDGKVVLAAGDIFSTAISGVGSLTATAHRNITLNGNVQTASDMTLTAAGGTLQANGTLTSNSGTVSLSGASTLLLDDVTAGIDILLNSNTLILPDITLQADRNITVAQNKTATGLGPLTLLAIHGDITGTITSLTGPLTLVDSSRDQAPLEGTSTSAVAVKSVGFPENSYQALMTWMTQEFGISENELNVSLEGTLFGSTNMNPYGVCLAIQNTSNILQDSDGTRIAALTQIITNEFGAGPASEEYIASIANAFAEHSDDGTSYAVASQWIDAFVDYVRLANSVTRMDTERVMALAMDKYGSPIAGDNDAFVAYLQTRVTSAIGG